MRRIRNAAGALGVLCAMALAVLSGAATGSTLDVAAPEVPADGAPADGYQINQHPSSTVFEPAPGVIAGNPMADAVDGVDAKGNHTRSVLVSWQSNADVAAADSERTLIHSDDAGYTFPSAHAEGISGWYHKLRNGEILGVEFVPSKVIDSHRVQLLQKRSKDGGKSWRTEYGTFTTDKTLDPAKFNRGIRVDGDILQDPDGNLLLTYYTNNSGDAAGSAGIAISTDNGRSWQRRATVFQGTATRAYSEVGISWASNGDLVAVVRNQAGSTLEPLYTARSSDQGRTWSTPVPLPISTAFGEPAPPSAVMPVLHLLPNGVMTLTFGRPDNWLAISPDGLGHSFEQAQVTYANYPDQDTGAFQRSHGSSGNGTHVVVASNKILQVGDNCAPSWGCPATDAGFGVDNKYRIWKKFIDILSPGVGKIDLLGRYRAGTVKIETNMGATDRQLPGMGPTGAIDGSTDWASSAVRKGGFGHADYTLTLDKTYRLTKAGLSLHPGLPSSAVVQVSTDKKNWTTVVDTGSISSYALDYFPIDTVAVKFVRVSVTDPNRDRAGNAFLNEIELYSTSDSFENDAVDAAPRGYTDTIGATVTDVDTNGDGHALRLADAWKDKQAQASWVNEPAAEQGLSFRYTSMGYARTLGFAINGTAADGRTVPAYQLSQMSDGAIAWYDGKTWQKIAPAGSAPQKTWHSITVPATLTGAQVSLDGKAVGTVQPTTAGVTALNGHKFTTTGTAPTYDNFVIDDVDQSIPN